MRLRLELTAPCLLAPTLYPPSPCLLRDLPFLCTKETQGKV